MVLLCRILYISVSKPFFTVTQSQVGVQTKHISLLAALLRSPILETVAPPLNEMVS